LVGLRSDGTADVVAVFRSVLEQPGQLPALVRIALDARIAGAALRRGRRMLGAGLGFPDFGEDTAYGLPKKGTLPSLSWDRAWLSKAAELAVFAAPEKRN
jgi:hypothetical protein